MNVIGSTSGTRSLTTTYAAAAQGRKGTAAIEVTTRHDKERKALITSAMYVEIQQRDGYTVRLSTVFEDPYVTLNAAAVGRYSQKALDIAHGHAERDMLGLLRYRAQADSRQSAHALRLLELLGQPVPA